jgi:fermentation-respiration switch protein FrsA (DUF1100 family)
MRTPRPIAALFLLGLLAACGGDDEATVTTAATPSSEEVLAAGAYGVGVATIVYTDPTRPTAPHGGLPASTSRRLATEVWYPIADASGGTTTAQRNAPFDASGGPYPLIIYSHGFSDQRTGGGYLGRHLASYGYVVAAPDFPLTNIATFGGPQGADVVNQPGDVSFLIDTLLADGDDNRFAGAIDATRIGLAGLSLGGLTTSLTSFHPTLRDDRVRAAVSIAGPGCFFGERLYDSAEVPLLLIHGDLDGIVPYTENGPYNYSIANAPKYFLTVLNGSHTSFSEFASILLDQAENSDEPGCLALGSGQAAGEDEGGGFFGDLGGEENGIIEGDCPAACRGPFPRTVRGPRQRQLAILGAFPFFEAYLRDRGEMRAFLEERAAAENAELTLQFTR